MWTEESRGRPREVDFRGPINAVCYLVRLGCGWRMLPIHDVSKAMILVATGGLMQCGNAHWRLSKSTQRPEVGKKAITSVSFQARSKIWLASVQKTMSISNKENNGTVADSQGEGYEKVVAFV